MNQAELNGFMNEMEKIAVGRQHTIAPMLEMLGMTALPGAAIGGATGALTAPEGERLKRGLIGAGLGAAALPAGALAGGALGAGAASLGDKLRKAGILKDRSLRKSLGYWSSGNARQVGTGRSGRWVSLDPKTGTYVDHLGKTRRPPRGATVFEREYRPKRGGGDGLFPVLGGVAAGAAAAPVAAGVAAGRVGAKKEPKEEK